MSYCGNGHAMDRGTCVRCGATSADVTAEAQELKQETQIELLTEIRDLLTEIRDYVQTDNRRQR